jgi:hypothetical protein
VFTPKLNTLPMGIGGSAVLPPGANIQQAKPVEQPPESKHFRVVHYNADHSGCGLWRMSWPAHLLNYHNKTMVTESTVMITDPNWYFNVKAIRLQRQATNDQKKFVAHLKQMQDKIGFKLIYEIDDVVFREDIPDYNKFKTAFLSDDIRNNTTDIINMCDEVTVTCDFMKELYMERTGKKEITVLPNFPPRFWMGNFFDERRVSHNYDKHKKRPRILYAGSGAHFDVENRVGQRDDFEHVNKAIIDTRHKYRWVFLGAYPPLLHPYIQKGEIEFHPWQRLYEYPKKIYDLEIQMSVAPLQDNNFNKAKSDLKYIEACCYGIPVACQDLVTYKDAEIKFKTGEEMLKCIEEELGRVGRYKNQAIQRRKVAESRFLELDKNLDCYLELYSLPYRDPKRVNLARYNP